MYDALVVETHSHFLGMSHKVGIMAHPSQLQNTEYMLTTHARQGASRLGPQGPTLSAVRLVGLMFRRAPLGSKLIVKKEFSFG